MVIDRNDNYSLYMITTDKRSDTKKIVVLVLLLLVLIGLIIIAKNSIEVINQHKIYEQYEAQLMALQKHEEDRKIQIEKKKQEKKPIITLTQERKR